MPEPSKEGYMKTRDIRNMFASSAMQALIMREKDIPLTRIPEIAYSIADDMMLLESAFHPDAGGARPASSKAETRPLSTVGRWSMERELEDIQADLKKHQEWLESLQSEVVDRA
jgi:hypothetical protein